MNGNFARYMRQAWSFITRSDEFVVVARSIFGMNRMIGLLPKLISKTPDGDYTIEQKPSGAWVMYVSFLVMYGVATTIIVIRMYNVELPTVLFAYFFGRVFTAAGIHIR